MLWKKQSSEGKGSDCCDLLIKVVLRLAIWSSGVWAFQAEGKGQHKGGSQEDRVIEAGPEGKGAVLASGLL